MPQPPEDRLWLFGVARNVLANHRRSADRRARLHLRVASSADRRDAAEPDDRDDAVWRALGSLSPDDLDLLLMRAWDGLAIGEIAAVVGATPNAITQRYGTAKRRLAALLAELDPVRRDPAPAPGSTRHQLIQEKIQMNTTFASPDTTSRSTDTVIESAGQPAGRSNRFGRRFLPAAASVAVLAGGAAVLWPGGAPRAEAAVRTAAGNLAEITTLRAEMTTVDESGTSSSTGEFSGDDARVTQTMASGEQFTFTVVGDTIYYEDGSGTSSEPVGPNGRLAPFAEASAAVIEAAMTGSEVDDRGTSTLDGLEVRHVVLAMTDESRAALRALTPAELAWFELESPDGLSTLDVFLADELIQQITVTGDTIGTRAIRYFDFNADITIAAPAD